MNLKDYKEIAKVVKDYLPVSAPQIQAFIVGLADYFENQWNIKLKEYKNDYKKSYVKTFSDRNGFNRKQFLKDCGVN